MMSNLNIQIIKKLDARSIQQWKELYNVGAAYNLSYEWCALWLKHFGDKMDLSVIVIYDKDELKLLAPFYIKKNRLHLIGQKPDLYDEFNVLYKDKKYLDKLIEFILQNKLEINFKHVNSQSEFGQGLIKAFSSKGIRQISQVTELKPALVNEFSPKRKMKDDIKRCKNNTFKLFNENLIFDYSTDKNDESIEEFIQIHKARWHGGMLVKKKNLENFIKELVKTNNEVVLSKLYLEDSKKTVAYHLGYKDSNNTFWSSMPAYNVEYRKISPGKVLLFELLTMSFNEEITHFDFGRGSEPYKNWFSNQEDVLFNIMTYNNNGIAIKIKNLMDKIFKLIF